MNGNDTALAYYHNPTQENKERVINGYDKLVKSIANKYQKFVDMDDLISVGYMGILKALDVYNPDSSKFTTLAHRYVTGYILHYIRDFGSPLKMPTWEYDLIKRHRNRYMLITDNLHKKLTIPEIALELGLSEKYAKIVSDYLETDYRFNSLNLLLNEEETGNYTPEALWEDPLHNPWAVQSKESEMFQEACWLVKSDASIRAIADSFNCSFTQARQLKKEVEQYIKVTS